MYQGPIDYDAGVISRHSQQFGLEVYMYRKAPGKYYTASGQLIPAAIAATAGFDVEAHARKRRAAEMIESAAAKINAEIGAQQQTRTVVKSFGLFDVYQLGPNRFSVETHDGTLLTKGIHLDQAGAFKLAEAMAAENPEGEEHAPGDGADGGRTAGADGRRNRKIAP